MEFFSGDFIDASEFMDEWSDHWGSDDGGQSCPKAFLALRVLRDGRVQAQASSADSFLFGDLLGSEPRRKLGPGVCRYCLRRVFDDGKPAVAGSEILHLHERWDHLDLFQEILEPMVAASVAAGGTRRRGKKGKDAKRMAKTKVTESAPEENNQLVQQFLKIALATDAPCSAPLDPATTCPPPVCSIFGKPIPAFHLDLVPSSCHLGS
jgi:hypothetical protein